MISLMDVTDKAQEKIHETLGKDAIETARYDNLRKDINLLCLSKDVGMYYSGDMDYILLHRNGEICSVDLKDIHRVVID